MIKKNESIWHYLSPGLGGFKLPRRLLWYEAIPGIMAFPAVTLGKSRWTFLSGFQYLVLYRSENKGSKAITCAFEWVRAKELVDREDYDYINKKYERRKQKQNRWL